VVRQRQSIHRARHLDIGEKDPYICRSRLKNRERVVGPINLHDLIALEGQRIRCLHTNQHLVLGHQDDFGMGGHILQRE